MMQKAGGGVIGGGIASANGRSVIVAGGGGAMVAGGGAAGGGVCGCEGTGSPVMTYVGSGGSYTTETTWKYVGEGAGEFEYVTPTRSCGFVFVGLGVGVLFLAVIVVLLFVNPINTTTPAPIGPPGNCLLWGDPHVETFDHAFTNWFDEGEYWVVKSPTVHIQGRFLATPFTNGLAATHQIAVGGPFMLGHKIVVGPMDNGQITMDGQPVLQAFPSSLTDPASGIKLQYNGWGNLVDSAQGHLQKRIVHMDLPLGVHIQVMRWANHINVKITMTPRVGGQDGVCGTFNGNPSDDSTRAVLARVGGRIPPGKLLFNTAAIVGPGGRHVTLADCDQAKRDHAVALCKGSTPRARGA